MGSMDSRCSFMELLLRTSAYRENRPGWKATESACPAPSDPHVRPLGTGGGVSVSWDREVRVGLLGEGVPAIFGHPTWPCPHMPRGPEADGCARPTCRTSFITLQIGGPDSQLLDVTCSCLIPEDICCGRVTSTLIQANLPLKAGGRTQ